MQIHKAPTLPTPMNRLRVGVQAGALTAAIALVGAAGLATSATAASMATAQVEAPVTIALSLDTDLLAYDIAWSNNASAARQALADQAINAMQDPCMPYVLELRQLPVAWRPLPAAFATTSGSSPASARRHTASPSFNSNVLRDMNGNAIDRNKARLGRLNYERDIEEALLDILERIRAQRPGAMISIHNFVPPETYGARAGSYQDLIQALDFVVMQMPATIGQPTASANGLSARARARTMASSGPDFDRIFTMADAPENLWVLVAQNGVWTAVDDEPLPEMLMDEAPDDQPDWTESPSTPNDAGGDNGNTEPGGEAPDESSDDNASTPPPVVIEPDEPDGGIGNGDDGDDPDDDPIDQTFGDDEGAPSDDAEPDAPSDDDAAPGPSDDDGPDEEPNDDIDDDDDVPPPSDDDDDDTVTNPGGAPQAPPSDDDQPDDPPADDGPPDMPDDDDEPVIINGPAPILVPGAGFAGPTPQPAPIGSGAGSDATAIARWDVVPFQTFDDEFAIGVVAFHINGIDRVEFSVDGGPWSSVYEMSHNARTGVWEYVAKLDADDFDDGQVEVRAIAYPNAGVPRVLAGPINMGLNDARVRGEYSMFLSANAGGTLDEHVRWVSPSGNDDTGDGSSANPFMTIAKAVGDVQDDHGAVDGATIYLKPGDYDFGQTAYASIPSTTERWVTIAGAPGQSRDAARIVSRSGNGLRTKLVRIHNLTVTGTTLPAGGSANYNRLWMDDVVLRGLDPTDGSTVIRGAHWTGGLFSTDVHYTNSIRAVKEGELTRNALITDIGGDAFREVRGLAINCEVRDLLNLDGTHNDVMQFNAPDDGDPFENIILYGIRAVDNIAGQSFFIATQVPMHRDIAVVNYITAATGGGGAQWNDRADHVLFWNYTILNQSFVIRDAGQSDEPIYITNLSMQNCVFDALKLTHSGPWPSMDDQSWAKNNHYIDMETYGSVAPGEGATTGGTYAQLFMNPAGNNFRPAPTSPLANRVFDPLVPVDAALHVHGSPAAIGAMAEVGDQ